MRELEGLIRDTDRRIREAFEETFDGRRQNFEEVAEQLFPGGRGRLRLVREDAGPRPVLGGGDADDDEPTARRRRGRGRGRGARTRSDGLGVEIEITPGRQGDQAADAAVRRREVADRAGVPVRRLPRPAVPVLHPRRGRGRARRPQHRPLPHAAAPLLRPRAVHRRHPPEAHDGGRRLPVRRLDGRQRRLQGRLAAAPAAARGRGASPRPAAEGGGAGGLNAAAVRRHRLHAQRLAGPPAKDPCRGRPLGRRPSRRRTAPPRALALRAPLRGRRPTARGLVRDVGDARHAAPARRRGPAARAGDLRAAAARARAAAARRSSGCRRPRPSAAPTRRRRSSAEHGPLTRHELAARLRAARRAGRPPRARRRSTSSAAPRSPACWSRPACAAARSSTGPLEPGPPPDRDEALAELARRYAAAHAPATAADFAAWSGLPAADVRAAWDGAAAPQGEPERGGVRLLRAFDEWLLGWAARDVVTADRAGGARRVRAAAVAGSHLRPVADRRRGRVARPLAAWSDASGADPRSRPVPRQVTRAAMARCRSS